MNATVLFFDKSGKKDSAERHREFMEFVQRPDVKYEMRW
jgi:hypothetical protein